MSKQQQSLMMDRVKTIHFIGIGGAGMNGIAEVLLQEGYQITGSDLGESAATKRLQELGATVYKGHQEKNIEGANVVVVSTAIPQDNPEIVAARHARIPIVARAEMLAEIMRFRYGIAVAGTHGKTTTTSLIANVLTDAGMDPSYVIGGLLNRSGSNAYLGANQILVAEADESDASFLHLQPMMSVVTNIDADHMQTYNNDFSVLRETFIKFLHHLPFYGLCVLCLDDPVVKEILSDVGRPYLTYGFNDEADVRATNFRQHGIVSEFTVICKKHNLNQDISLNLPGQHNVQNALAAITIALELGADMNTIAQSLKQFSGIGRRFNILGDLTIGDKTVTLVDDYGHHPREVAATIAAARLAWPDRRITMLFQPHRYSRTRDVFDDFVRELSELDCLMMLPVYAAGEDEIPGANSQALCRSIRQRSKLDPVLVEIDEIYQVLENIVDDNDVIIAQGAGSVGRLAQDLVKQLKK